MAIKNNDDDIRGGELTHMARLFKQIGDYKTSLEYFITALLIPQTKEHFASILRALGNMILQVFRVK